MRLTRKLFCPARVMTAIWALVLVSTGSVANAFQMRWDKWNASFDTTVTYGVAARTENQDQVGLSQYGNRAYDRWDLVQNNIKASHDLLIQDNAGRFGVFTRGVYFYDFALADVPLNAGARRAEHSGNIRDAYVFGTFGADNDLTLKFGRQVISWGESTFIGSGLDDIHTFDLTILRQPGVEIKDAFLPTNSLYGVFNISPGLSLEAFTLFEFDDVSLDPSGSFFGGSDAALDGGGGLELAPDGGGTSFAGLTRSRANEAGNDGQFGIALRYYNQNWGPSGSEIAFYYQNLHDHNPQFSTVAGSGTFHLDYAEDIERYGVSFNTLIGSFLLAGEYSYKHNATISGLDWVQVAYGAPFGITPVGGTLLPGLPANKIAAVAGDTVKGFARHNRHQLQFTSQKNWVDGKYFFKADSLDTIGEIAVTYAERPSNYNLLNPVTSTAWGFVINNSVTYNDAVLGANLKPSVTFSWDVDGIASDSRFIEGRKSLSFKLAWDWHTNWKGDFGYVVRFDGNKEFNNFGSRMITNLDRDFVSASVSYGF